MVVAAKPIEKTTGWWVTHQTAPAWMVGEDGALRNQAAPNRAAAIGDDHYPGDYAGKIQSVTPADEPIPHHVAHTVWLDAVKLELSAADHK